MPSRHWRPSLPLVSTWAIIGTTLSFWSVFADVGWLIPTMVAILAVAGTGALARRLSVPPLLVPLASTLTLLAVVTVTFASHAALAGVLPTPAAAKHLASLLMTGSQEILRNVAPVPSSPGIVLMLVCGVGIVTILVDTLALALRSPALAGFPLLLLYTVPAAFAPGGGAAVGFVAGGSAYLWMIYLERQDRLEAWGRRSGKTMGADGASAHVRRPVIMAGVALPVAIALFVPAVIPGLSTAFVPPFPNAFDNGNRTVQVTNPILDLRDNLRRRDNRPLLTYTTNSPDRLYIRLVGLDAFNGERWDTSRLQVPQRQRVDRGMELAGLGGEVARTDVETKITVDGLQSQWLPLPYPATKVRIDGTWLYDKETFNVFTYERPDPGRSYVVEHLSVQPSAEQLGRVQPEPQGLDRFLELPAGMDPAIARAANEQIRKKGAETAYDKAVVLRDWLRTFEYNERAPDGTGVSTLVAFLQKKSGFCVHFASAMAVMARQQGIPARVAVGFLPGRRGDAESPEGADSWVVTARDAHAWPELYFDGIGWVAFEPTPSERTEGRSASGLPAPGVPANPNPGEPQTSPSTLPSPSTGAGEVGAAPPTRGADTGRTPKEKDPEEEKKKEEEEESSLRLWLVGGFGLLLFATVLVVLLAAAVSVLIVVMHRVRRRRRWSAARASQDPRAMAAAAIAQLREDCVDYGIPWRAQQTPRQTFGGLAARLAADSGNLPAAPQGEQRHPQESDRAVAALQRLFGLAEQLEYAPRLGPVGQVEEDCDTVRQALARTSTPAQRRRANWWPPSVTGGTPGIRPGETRRWELARAG